MLRVFINALRKSPGVRAGARTALTGAGCAGE